jgi:hypothetical protein
MPGTVPPLIPLEAEYDECRTPKFLGLGLILSPSTHLDPASTRPRPTAGQQRSKACMPQDPGSFHRLILYVTMVSGDGRPFSEHVATMTSIALDKTSLLRHHPASLPSLDPIKGKAGDSTKGEEKGKTSHHPTVADQHLKQSPLYSLFLSETWDRLPLSKLVTPTQALRCKEIQYLSLPLDVGPSFARTRINPRVFPLHHHLD